MNTAHMGRPRDRNLKLGLFAGFAFYIGLIAIQARFPIFDYDFVGFWSVGRIASMEGYSRVYDLDLLAEYQKPLGLTEIVPTPFPAVFILPLQAIALLPLQTGVWVWRALSLLLLIAYCAHLFRGFSKTPLARSGFFVLLLALPVYINFAWAQVNVIPMIAVGEFIRLSLKGRPYLSGIALGLLLIKPQLAVLLVLMLLIQGRWQTLAGFATSGGVVMISSILLTGMNGSLQLLNLWVKYSAGLASNAPEYMANWRMLGVHLHQVLSPSISWTVTGLGMIATAFLAVSMWRKRAHARSPLSFLYAVLGTLSATLLTSWHSHVHHMVVLIPPLLLIMALEKNSMASLTTWVFSGMVLYLFVLLAGFMAGILTLPNGFGSIVLGVWGFAGSLFFLLWSQRNMRIRTTL